MKIRANPPLTPDRARELLAYEPLTGVVTNRLTRSGAIAGSLSGSLSRNGYRKIGLDGERYHLHRVIWLMVRGAWPAEEIDHINRDRGDNRWCNIREASRSINVRNVGVRKDSSSGIRGVTLTRGVRWRAKIRLHGRPIHLGYFATKEEAIAAHAAGIEKYFGTL